MPLTYLNYIIVRNFHMITVNSFPNKPWSLRVCSTSLLKTLWEKEKLLETSNFSFYHSVFYPFWKPFFYLYKIQNCHLHTLSFWKRLKIVVSERVNDPDREGVSSIFSFSNNIFKSFSVSIYNTSDFALTLYHTIPSFSYPGEKPEK